MILYLLPASLVFTFCATKLIQDESTATSDLGMWAFLTLVALIWPVTLPSILRKQYLNWRQHHQDLSKPLYNT